MWLLKLVEKPSKYRLEYQDVEGKTQKLTLVDIDVINDLALVKAEVLDKSPYFFPRSSYSRRHHLFHRQSF